MNILKKEFKEEKINLIITVLITFFITLFWGFFGAFISISFFTIFIGSEIISKEKDKIDFLISKPIIKGKIFFLKLVFSIIYVFILLTTMFIGFKLIIEFWINYIDWIPDKNSLFAFLLFISVCLSIPLFISVFLYDTTTSFTGGIVIIICLELLVNIIFKKVEIFDFMDKELFYSCFNLVIFAIFTYFSYFSFKNRDYPV